MKKYQCAISENEGESNATVIENVFEVVVNETLPCDSTFSLCDRFPSLETIRTQGLHEKLDCLNLNTNWWRNCKKLIEISLPRSKFYRVDDKAFAAVPNLERFHVEENQIKFIHQKAFSNLLSLTTLSFSSNKITELHRDLFVNNFRLVSLSFSRNLISELHPDLFRSLVYLNFLDFDRNRIKVLHAIHFANLLSLKLVYFGTNGLSAIEKGSFNRTLTYGYFESNDCVNLNLGGLLVSEIDRRLEVCYANYLIYNFNMIKCNFGKNPNFICTVSNAEVLTNINYTFYITSNKFTPNDYNDDEVKTVVLQKSKFDYIPSKFCETFKNLQSLKASRVGISTSLNSISNCTSLLELDLSHNLIEVIELGTFSSLYRLRTINLESNKIENLDGFLFSSLTALESLNIGDNFIAKISENFLKPFKNLHAFHAHQNFLTEIDLIFIGNRELKTINFEANQISSVHSDAFRNMAKLSHLNFKGNNCAHKVYNSSDLISSLETFLMHCNKVYCIIHCDNKL